MLFGKATPEAKAAAAAAMASGAWDGEVAPACWFVPCNPNWATWFCDECNNFFI